MSLIALSLNLVLAILLVAALIIGLRLERRLKAVREGQLAFAQAVNELDAAAIKARDGLADLRAATDEATDLLGGRIARAREAADRLEGLVRRADAMPAPQAYAAPQPAPQPQPAQGPEGGLAALLERLKQAETVIAHNEPAPVAVGRPPRQRPSVDDDLFEDFGGRQ